MPHEGSIGPSDCRKAQARKWGSSRGVEEDTVAAAAASAIAGVEWRELRRDTVAALVRQLDRCVYVCVCV